jgi:hypothetical protein
LTNKAAKGKKGAIVAMIVGTAQTVIAIIEETPLKLRNTVSEITHLAANMGLIAKSPNNLRHRLIYSCFYFNFGIRDNASLNSCAKISLEALTRNQD